MAVNSTEIASIYDTLLTGVLVKYDAMWTDNKIDAETYAQLVGQASSQLLSLSAELVQKQEQLDDQFLTSAKERESVDTEISIKHEQSTKDLLVKDEQIASEQYKRASIMPQELNNLKMEERTKKAGISKIMMDVSATQTQINMNKTQMLNDFNTKKAEKDILKQKLLTETANTTTVGNQGRLLAKQTKGAENNMHKEKAKMAMETVALMSQADAKKDYSDLEAIYNAGTKAMVDWTA